MFLWIALAWLLAAGLAEMFFNFICSRSVCPVLHSWEWSTGSGLRVVKSSSWIQPTWSAHDECPCWPALTSSLNQQLHWPLWDRIQVSAQIHFRLWYRVDLPVGRRERWLGCTLMSVQPEAFWMQSDLGVCVSCLIHEVAGYVKLLISPSSLGCPLFSSFFTSFTSFTSLLLLSYPTFCGNSLLIASFI